MAGVHELAAAIRLAVSKLPAADLTMAADLLGEAMQLLEQTGSTADEMQHLHGALQQATWPPSWSCFSEPGRRLRRTWTASVSVSLHGHRQR